MPEFLPQPVGENFIEVLEAWADRTPDALAFCFLVDGEEEGPRRTFSELARDARCIAAKLRETAEPGDRALLIYPPGIEFLSAFFGCLFAGVVAVPAYPPRPERLTHGMKLVGHLLNDCRPKVVMSVRSVAAMVERNTGGLPGFEGVRWLVTDDLDVSGAHRYRQPRIAPQDVAFLQYTSGSTADPKGVMITHGNVMHNERIIRESAEHVDIVRGMGVCWLPLYHDMGLIGVLQSVFVGVPCMVMSPLGMLQKPFRWLKNVSRYRADTSGGPSFGYDLCVDRTTPEERATLDLSNWSIAGIGAEPIRPETLDRFASTFEPCGFHPEAFVPGYGLAESTFYVTGGDKTALPVIRWFNTEALAENRVVATSANGDAARAFVGCGHTRAGQELVIVDPQTLRACPPDTVGEIWIRGPSVAKGYWNRPEETARLFGAHRADTGDGPFLRSGDLGFVRENELFITGRLKDLLVIRGRNHYPQDIEQTVQAVHPALRVNCGAAFDLDTDAGSQLVVIQEIDRQSRRLDLDILRRDIRRAVAKEHELQVFDIVFLRNASIPKTSSGKVRRQACKLAYQNQSLTLWKGRRTNDHGADSASE